MAAQQLRRTWNLWHAAGALVLVAFAGLAMSDAWSDLLRIALKDEESSHILIVPIAAAWIVLVRRESLRNCRPTGFWAGPALMAIGWTLWLVGLTRDIQAFWHLGAVVFAIGGIVAIVGSDILRRLWPAFLVLAFLVPVPGSFRQSIAQPMQTATAHVTQNVSELIGMNVECFGNTLFTNGTQVAVAEACNGMRMVFTLFLVSYTFAFTTPLWTYVRVIIIAASPVTAIVCNVIRLVPTIWVYGRYSPHFADVFHTVSGWLMLLVGFLVLLGVIRLLRWLSIPISPYRLVTT